LCEKQTKVLEALEKLKGGVKFPEVAAQYSEDKARQGVWIALLSRYCSGYCSERPLSHLYDHSFISLES
jgi:NIMA-interacting peptidyl-prolyl cis-trans isomerase 4